MKLGSRSGIGFKFSPCEDTAQDVIEAELVVKRSMLVKLLRDGRHTVAVLPRRSVLSETRRLVAQRRGTRHEAISSECIHSE